MWFSCTEGHEDIRILQRPRTTGTKPFNLFARIAAEEMQQPGMFSRWRASGCVLSSFLVVYKLRLLWITTFDEVWRQSMTTLLDSIDWCEFDTICQPSTFVPSSHPTHCVVKQQFALKKFSVCPDFSFATMGCGNSVELCSSGEIKVKLHHVGEEPKMVKKMSKTLEESIIEQSATWK